MAHTPRSSDNVALQRAGPSTTSAQSGANAKRQRQLAKRYDAKGKAGLGDALARRLAALFLSGPLSVGLGAFTVFGAIAVRIGFFELLILSMTTTMAIGSGLLTRRWLMGLPPYDSLLSPEEKRRQETAFRQLLLPHDGVERPRAPQGARR